MAERLPQTEQKHPDEYQRDLNPDHMAGQNVGPSDTAPERTHRTAYDTRSIHRALSDWPDDELKEVPIVDEGARLRQGATYLDLCRPGRDEFTATGAMTAGPGQAIVPKDEVPYPTWNRLRGIDDPERTGADPHRYG